MLRIIFISMLFAVPGALLLATNDEIDLVSELKNLSLIHI